MKRKEIKLVKKLSKLLKQLNCRNYLHHFGPKKFKFVYHALALLLKESLKCSFRRVESLLDMLDVRVPTYSALCKSRKRIPTTLWASLLKLTAGETSGITAIDGTGFSRTNPSFHYVKRIDGKNPRGYAKLSALFDILKRKFLALRIRAKPRHDIKDVKPLLRQVKNIKSASMDSAYDAESVFEYCWDRNIRAIVKPKKNARKGFYRKKQRRNFTEEEYHRRSLIESGFGSLKRKYGGSVSAKRPKNLKAEIYCKAICHNLGLCWERFSTKPLVALTLLGCDKLVK